MAGSGMMGKQLGNYVVKELIGEGGMGAVYAGEHRFLGDQVAIKVLHGSYANNPRIAQRFFQEAKSARDIGHPSIVTVIDFGQSEDGSLYLVMERLAGRSLARLLSQGALGEETSARIAAALAEALEVAHAKGVIHRDLKPDNIFIVGAGVKILDFGIAKVMSSSANTGSGAMLGTPRYMAPEQAKGAKFVGPYSDVYSLGVILFEMVTGRVPYEGDVTEVLVKILTEVPPRPSSLAQVSPEMEALILACLSKEPSARPASMAELRERLAPWVGPPQSPPISVSNAPTMMFEESTRARPITTLSHAVGEASRSQSRSQPGEPAPKRRKSIVMVIAGGAALALAAGGLLAFRPKPPERELPKLTAAPPTQPTRDIPNTQPGSAETAPPPTAGKTPQPAESAAATAPTKVKLTLRSDPDQAEILDASGQVLNKTPAILEVSLPFQFDLRHKGYEQLRQVIDKPEDAAQTFKLKRSAVKPKPAESPATPKSSQPPPKKEPKSILD